MSKSTRRWRRSQNLKDQFALNDPTGIVPQIAYDFPGMSPADETRYGSKRSRCYFYNIKELTELKYKGRNTIRSIGNNRVRRKDIEEIKTLAHCWYSTVEQS